MMELLLQSRMKKQSCDNKQRCTVKERKQHEQCYVLIVVKRKIKLI